MTDDPPAARWAGLCASCRHQRVITTARGSRFSLCELAKTHRAFPRYPSLPVTRCPGYTPRQERDAD